MQRRSVCLPIMCPVNAPFACQPPRTQALPCLSPLCVAVLCPSTLDRATACCNKQHLHLPQLDMTPLPPRAQGQRGGREQGAPHVKQRSKGGSQAAHPPQQHAGPHSILCPHLPSTARSAQPTPQLVKPLRIALPAGAGTHRITHHSPHPTSTLPDAAAACCRPAR